MLQRYTGFVEKISVMAYVVDLKIQVEIREAEQEVEKAIAAGEEEANHGITQNTFPWHTPLGEAHSFNRFMHFRQKTV